MEEKIKVYIPENINRILLKDIELFEFFKKDHSLNKNDFFNRLIVNYYKAYSETTLKTYDSIHNILNQLEIDNLKSELAAVEILKHITKENEYIENKKLDAVISIKPTRYSSYAFDYIQNCLLNRSSLSGWIRNLLISYVKLPQDKREKIIFKENFETIAEAISQNKKIFFTTATSTKNGHLVSPYAIVPGKEELFNYLLLQENDSPLSFRISRIKNVVIVKESRTISQESENYLEKMIKYGPQFSYSLQEKEPIKIRFNELGKYMYEKIYIHRPPYALIEGDIYTFECSINQAMQYFRRFGRNAIVLQPEKLRTDMEIYYQMAYKTYHKQGKQNSRSNKENNTQQ